MDEIQYATDDEDRPLDHVTVSNVFRHFRPENSLLRSELSDFTLYRNQREERRLQYEYRNLDLASRVASSGIDQQRKALVQSLRRTRRIVSCPGTSFRPRQRHHQKHQHRQPATTAGDGVGSAAATATSQTGVKAVGDVAGPDEAGFSVQPPHLRRAISLFIPASMIDDDDDDGDEDDDGVRHIRRRQNANKTKNASRKFKPTVEAVRTGQSAKQCSERAQQHQHEVKMADGPRPCRVRTLSVSELGNPYSKTKVKVDVKVNVSLAIDDQCDESDDILVQRHSFGRPAASNRAHSLDDSGSISSNENASRERSDASQAERLESRKNAESNRLYRVGVGLGLAGGHKRRRCPFAAMRSLSLHSSREDAVAESEASSVTDDVSSTDIGRPAGTVASSDQAAAACNDGSHRNAENRIVNRNRKCANSENSTYGSVRAAVVALTTTTPTNAGCDVAGDVSIARTTTTCGVTDAELAADCHTGSASDRTQLVLSGGCLKTTSISNGGAIDKNSDAKTRNEHTVESIAGSRPQQPSSTLTSDQLTPRRQETSTQQANLFPVAVASVRRTGASATVGKLTSRVTSAFVSLSSTLQPTSSLAFQSQQRAATLPINSTLTPYQLYCDGRRRGRQGRPLSMPVAFNLKTLARSNNKTTS